MDANFVRKIVTTAIVNSNKSPFEVHAAIDVCLQHAAGSGKGDTSELVRLLNGIGYGKKVARQFIEAHSPVKFGKAKNGDVTATCKGWADYEWDWAAIQAGNTDPTKRWDNYAEESEPKPFTQADLIKYVTSIANNDGKGKKVIDIEAKLAAKRMLAAIKAA